MKLTSYRRPDGIVERVYMYTAPAISAVLAQRVQRWTQPDCPNCMEPHDEDGYCAICGHIDRTGQP